MKILTKALLLASSVAVSVSAFAADPLAGTQWTTYGEDGQPKAVVRISDHGGKLSGTIVQVLDPRAQTQTTCQSCVGKFHNKPLTGATIFTGLEPAGDGSYDEGKITDPENGKTYSMSATLNGSSLDVRGYMGVKALGRTQTWQQR